MKLKQECVSPRLNLPHCAPPPLGRNNISCNVPVPAHHTMLGAILPAQVAIAARRHAHLEALLGTVRGLHAVPLPDYTVNNEPQKHRSGWGAPASPESEKPWVEDFLRPRFRALLVDAAGTLLSPSEPAAEVYLRYGKKYGVNLSEHEILLRFREAYAMPWAESTIRYVGDGRPFWRHIVSYATGNTDPELFEEIYEYYARGEAWSVSPGACESLQRIRDRGIRTAIVSNFDTRLRRILRELEIDRLFDTVVVSAEVGVEKPNPLLFHQACEALEVRPEQAIHVGDDRKNDVFGARDAGCFVWLWGSDVHNFAEVERRLESGNLYDSLSGV